MRTDSSQIEENGLDEVEVQQLYNEIDRNETIIKENGDELRFDGPNDGEWIQSDYTISVGFNREE